MKQLAMAVASLSLAASVTAQSDQGLRISRNGSQPSAPGPAENFTGRVRVDTPFRAEAPARASGGLVTFEPGARSAWHTHPLGQTLIVTQGVGLVQRWGGPIQEIRPGDVGLDPAGREALARRVTCQRDEPCRHLGAARRQERGVAREGQRRAVREPSMSGVAR